MGGTYAQLANGQQLSHPGQFDQPVVLEAAKPLSNGFERRARSLDGIASTSVEETADLQKNSDKL